MLLESRVEGGAVSSEVLDPHTLHPQFCEVSGIMTRRAAQGHEEHGSLIEGWHRDTVVCGMAVWKPWLRLQ